MTTTFDLPLGGTAIIARDGAALCRALGWNARVVTDEERDLTDLRHALRMRDFYAVLIRGFPRQSARHRPDAARHRSNARAILARIRARRMERREAA